jgi:hypothetical protein
MWLTVILYILACLQLQHVATTCILMSSIFIMSLNIHININRKADKEGSGELSLETFRQVMRESALLRDKDIDQVCVYSTTINIHYISQLMSHCTSYY